MNLLVCHRDKNALKWLKLSLADRFNVHATDTNEEAIELGKLYDYDAIVLGDAQDISTDTAIKSLRDSKIQTPILVLSENSECDAIVRSLTIGADDYVLSPCRNDELVARLIAIVRRSKGHARSIIQIGNLMLDVHEKRAEIDSVQVALTPKEYAVLELLGLRQGHIQTKEMILNQLYGGMDEPEIKIIDVFICKLRKKLPPDIIQTAWGRGYVIAKPAAGQVTESPVASEVDTQRWGLPSREFTAPSIRT